MRLGRLHSSGRQTAKSVLPTNAFVAFHGNIQAFEGFLSETDNGEPGFKGCEVKTCKLEIELAKLWIDLS